jgi:glycosyltransferase involved in cell wall biosynthesis
LKFWLPKGWTHLRLSFELCLRPPTVFFNPAHEVPLGYRRSKIATTIHDVAFRHVPAVYSTANLRRQQWAVTRAVKKAQVIFSVSDATKRDLIEFYKAAPEKIQVAKNAPCPPSDNPTPVQTVMVRYGLTPQKYVLFLGRVESKKNPMTLLRAFEELKAKYGLGHPLKLVLAGSKGFGGEKVTAAIAESRMARDIVLPGYVPDADIPALLSQALCFALPSVGEGFGIPVLEAMAAGVPVLASDIPALREVGGDAALFLPARDITKWATAIDNLLTNQELINNLRDKGHVQVQQFSWTTTAKAIWSGLRTAARS